MYKYAQFDQTQTVSSEEAVWSESALFVYYLGLLGNQLVFEILEH